MREPERARIAPRGRQRSRPYATTSGALLAAAAAPFSVVERATGSLLDAPRWLQGAAGLDALVLLVAAVVLVRRPRAGRLLATLGILGALGLAAPHLIVSPLSALAALVLSTVALALLHRVAAPLLQPSPARRRPVREGQAQGAALAALVGWTLVALAPVERSVLDTLTVGWALACATVLGVDWAIASLRAVRVRAALVLGAGIGSVALVPLLWGDGWWVTSALVLAASATAGLVRPRPRRSALTTFWDPLLGHPERLFVGTFAALCLGGTLLLALPQSASGGATIGFVDAAFTSTSAVCVTGLAVLDTPVDFTAFGQVVILVLIQIGGLGIMTFSTIAFWALGGRMSLRHEGAVASLISSRHRGHLFLSAKRIVQLTLAIEGAGAAVLAALFMARGDSVGVALWRGMFTSISAFCNAGFALQSDSLVSYQGSPFVLHTVGALIILGGLSPLAMLAIPAVLRRSAGPVSAQARLSLSASLVLLVVGFAFLLAFEWDDSLGGLSVVDKVHNAWFQSVTLRTAGFNSVDLTRMRSATLVLTLAWMFIGGSPGGTAGGVKTTTAAVLALSVVQAIRGQWTLEAFGRRIPERTRAKAAVVTMIALGTGALALVAVLLTQDMSERLAVFEVVSALGTVGLTIGGTAALDGIGKAIVIACMFVGRVGGLTLLMFLSSRRAPPALRRPEEEIDVG